MCVYLLKRTIKIKETKTTWCCFIIRIFSPEHIKFCFYIYNIYFYIYNIFNKMSKVKVGGKHYTTVEKKILVEILKKHKDIVENKKSDSSTLKEKDAAWSKVSEEYNMSKNIVEERSAQQLKKLWANMKATQRNLLTKQRQAILTTGGGPQEKIAEIDPDIAFIVPNLLEMAPTQFSSDLSEIDMYKHRQIIRQNPEKISMRAEDEERMQKKVEYALYTDILMDRIEPDEDIIFEDYVIENVTEESSEEPKCFEENLNVTDTVKRLLLEDIDTTKSKKQCIKDVDTQKTALEIIHQSENAALLPTSVSVPETSVAPKKNRQRTQPTATIRNKLVEINPEEHQLKMERLKRIIAEETEIAKQKLQREKNLLHHEELVQSLIVQHIKRMQEMEYREAKAKTQLSELQLQKENIN